MRWGIFLGIASIMFLALALFFSLRSFNAPQAYVGENQESTTLKDGVQEVTLSFKKYSPYKYNYSPEEIRVKQGLPVRIIGDKSLTGCYNSFLIPGLKIQHSFLSGKPLEFTPSQKGTFVYSCVMGMGTGKLIVN